MKAGGRRSAADTISGQCNDYLAKEVNPMTPPSNPLWVIPPFNSPWVADLARERLAKHAFKPAAKGTLARVGGTLSAPADTLAV